MLRPSGIAILGATFIAGAAHAQTPRDAAEPFAGCYALEALAPWRLGTWEGDLADLPDVPELLELGMAEIPRPPMSLRGPGPATSRGALMRRAHLLDAGGRPVAGGTWTTNGRTIVVGFEDGSVEGTTRVWSSVTDTGERRSMLSYAPPRFSGRAPVRQVELRRVECPKGRRPRRVLEWRLPAEDTLPPEPAGSRGRGADSPRP